MSETKAMWLGGGQFWCDAHRKLLHTIPFFYAHADAVCAACSDNAADSYLTRRQKTEMQFSHIDDAEFRE